MLYSLGVLLQARGGRLLGGKGIRKRAKPKDLSSPISI